MTPERERANRGPGRPRRPDNLERLAVYIPRERKRWLRHLAIDEGKDLGSLVDEALRLLDAARKQSH